jgi:hypothetical protein
MLVEAINTFGNLVGVIEVSLLEWGPSDELAFLPEEEVLLLTLARFIPRLVERSDALRSERPYKHGWTHEDAVTGIESNTGKHFDPRIVECFSRHALRLQFRLRGVEIESPLRRGRIGSSNELYL